MHGAARGKISGLPVADPHSPSVECRKCGGTGKRMAPDYSATLPGGEWNYPLIEQDCPYCNGQGRLIKPAVLRELARMETQ
jgi:DnaJ-class molecular chaperone